MAAFKHHIMTMVILLAASGAFAEQQMQDVVYLKNGSIIRGTMVEFVPDAVVKIETADGSVFVFSMEEVAKINKEKPVRMMEENTELTSRAEKTFHTYAENRFSKLAPKSRGMKLNGGLMYVMGAIFVGGGILAKDRPAEDRTSMAIMGSIMAGAGRAHMERANRITSRHSEMMKISATSPSEKEERERSAYEALVELANRGKMLRITNATILAAEATLIMVFKPFRVYKDRVVDGRTIYQAELKPTNLNYWMAAGLGIVAFMDLLINKSPEEEALEGYLNDKESGKMSFRIMPASPLASGPERQRVALVVDYRF